MQLTQQHEQAFVEQGFSLIDDVFTADEIARPREAIYDIYANGPRKNGILSSIDNPALSELYQHPNLEKIAQTMLGDDQVVLASMASLFKLPDNTTEWTRANEHVDIQFSVEELTQKPRTMMAMIMVFINDLPKGRGNTLVRPGSHMQIAQWLKANGKKPVRAQPTPMAELPELPYAEPIPVIGKVGQAMAFSTALIHCPSSNIDTEARSVLFINFARKGYLKQSMGNHDQHASRQAWRDAIRKHFRPERLHLLEDSVL